MKRGLLLILCVMAMPVMASHIVGGEFELLHVSANTYRVNLIVYFDLINGSPGARDNNVVAAIYRKRDNQLMENVSFGSPTETPVNYTQPECSNGQIRTSKLVYTAFISLPDSRYDDPEGYYIVWERCCRNYTITNIYSENPDVSGRAAGQTFYLEFPPVVRNGQAFVNSSPRLFPALNDYACPRKPYYVDFAGIDDDGDSLVYSLVTPLTTHSIVALPPLQPGPYPQITWRQPFSLQNILNGSPDMKITREGFLTATPTQQGLYVFAVKCEEFRKGVKIGEVRRDFQMLVVDACPQAEPPQIVGLKADQPGVVYKEKMQVTFSNTVADEERCVEVEVSDPDASKLDDNFVENVHIKAIPLGFKKDVSGILPQYSGYTLVNGEKVKFKICFEKCPYVKGPFEVGIVAYDDACSLPLSDTLRITVNIEPPPNAQPYFTTPDVTEIVNEGDVRTWTIRGRDDDGDKLFAKMIPEGFDLAAAGMTYTQTRLSSGELEAQLRWDTNCEVSDFSQKTDFTVKILLDDFDECSLTGPTFMTFNLKVKLPGSSIPVIDSDLTTDPFERVVTGLKRKVNESLKFNVKGIDADNDWIVLDVKGKDFDINNYSITFPAVSGNNFVQSQFIWNIQCDEVDLEKKDEFTFQFIVVDEANKCRHYNADTLDVVVKVLPPDNAPPVLQVANLNQNIQMFNNTISTTLGQEITLGLTGTDADKWPEPDLLKLQLVKVEGNTEPAGYVFADAEGRGTVESTFAWNPECSIFTDGVYENDYKFTFRVVDGRCHSQKADTVEVNINIRDIENDQEEFLPANFITPNGDNINDFFAMVKEDESGGFVNILPKDNCIGVFQGIMIFNRWGRRVFTSSDRDFRWFADGESAGIYYYQLNYSHHKYKGIITVAFDDAASSR